MLGAVWPGRSESALGTRGSYGQFGSWVETIFSKSSELVIGQGFWVFVAKDQGKMQRWILFLSKARSRCGR